MQILGVEIRRTRGRKANTPDPGLTPLTYNGTAVASEEQHLDKVNRAASDGAAHFFKETGPLLISFLRDLKNLAIEFMRDTWSMFSGPAKFAVWVVAIILLVGFVGGKIFSAAEWWIDGHTQGVVRQTIGTTHRVGDQMDRRIPDPPPVPEPTAAPQSQ